MSYLNLIMVIICGFFAGWCFSVDSDALGWLNLSALFLNALAVAIHLED